MELLARLFKVVLLNSAISVLWFTSVVPEYRREISRRTKTLSTIPLHSTWKFREQPPFSGNYEVG